MWWGIVGLDGARGGYGAERKGMVGLSRVWWDEVSEVWCGVLCRGG